MWRPRQPGAEEEPGGAWIGLVDGGGESRPPHAPAPLAGRRARPWRRARELEASLRHGVAGGECARREQGRAPPSGPRTADLEAAVVVRLAMVARRTGARACPSQPRARPRRSSHPKRHRAQAAPASSIPVTARCSIKSAMLCHLASIPPATGCPATSALFPNHQFGCSLPAASFRWRPEPPWLSQGPPP